MEIREAKDHDIPAIVELLKLSLGESLMPKSETFWRWKHLENPFGSSPVLLAEEKGVLIGVRAFMRWQWQMGDRTFQAVRAVDTATHPAHQGRGIFKTLTLKLLEQCRSEGVDFVFNTPNEKSKPGYLKMGWQEVGRLPIALQPYLSVGYNRTNLAIDWNEAVEALGQVSIDYQRLRTAFSTSYLRWRYELNPNVAYRFVSRAGAEPFLLVYRIRKVRGWLEVRVVDFLGIPALLPTALCAIRGRERGVGVVTHSGLQHGAGMSMLQLKVGPCVTSYRLAHSAPVRTFNNWSPSLGDMELF